MIFIDGKPVDLTKPQTWGGSIQLKPGGSITQSKDGVTTKVTHVPQQPREVKNDNAK